MIKKSGLFNIEYGIIFIMDYDSIVEIPEDTGMGSILNTKNCISMWTVNDIDGPTNISFIEMNENVEIPIRAVINVLSKTGKISVCDSNINRLIETKAFEISTVSIYSNDPLRPSVVKIFIEEHRGSVNI